MHFGHLFTPTGYDNMPNFSKEWKEYVLELFSKTIAKLNSTKSYSITEHRYRLYQTLELFKDEFNLEQIFSDYTSDIFKALVDDEKLSEDYVSMLIDNEKHSLVAEAVTETIKYFGFIEYYFTEKYDTTTLNSIILNKKIELNKKIDFYL